MADRITAALQTLETAKDDAELAPLLKARGYDTAKLDEGIAKQQAAQSAFATRQAAIGAQKEATADLAAAETSARQAYSEFRDTVRSIFKDKPTQTALGLSGRVPDDLQKFITAARASYEAALGTPAFLSQLSKYGFPQAKLESSRGLLDSFIIADNAQEAAKAAATRATQQRDEAVAELDAWMSQFRGIAKVATRSRPDLAKRMGL